MIKTRDFQNPSPGDPPLTKEQNKEGKEGNHDQRVTQEVDLLHPRSSEFGPKALFLT